jgi:hypothetical protein
MSMIFISYSLKDEAPFSSLCIALESANLPYWKQKLKAGTSLKDQLRDAISKCDVCIFIATRSSVTSQWCLNEIGAFWGAGKRIILFSANPDIENKLPPLFKGDYWTCDAREVINQVREELEEIAKNEIQKGATTVLTHSATGEVTKPEPVKEIKTITATQSASSVSLEGANSNMPQVATWWLRDFLNPVVNLIGEIKKEFNQNAFAIERVNVGPHSTAYIYIIDFFRRIRWAEMLTSDVGEYFLMRFPQIEKLLGSFGKSMDEFEQALSGLEESIEESPFFLKELINTYERLISRERIPRSQFENSNLQEIARLLLGQIHLEISNHPTEGKETLVRFIAYSLLELDVNFKPNTITEDQQLFYFCRDIAKELKCKEDSIPKTLEETKRLFDVIKGESSTVHQQLKRERFEIAGLYNATFEQ